MLRRASKRSAKESVKSKGAVSSTNTLDNPLGSTKLQERDAVENFVFGGEENLIEIFTESPSLKKKVSVCCRNRNTNSCVYLY